MGDGLPPDLVQLRSTLPIRALVLGIYVFSEELCGGVNGVLDHSVSQSSENSHSRTQIVEGGKRCVYEQRHVGMRQSWILW